MIYTSINEIHLNFFPIFSLLSQISIYESTIVRQAKLLVDPLLKLSL